ncbi:MAG: hypothetical protein ACI8QZ_003910 [Chlamydiales bacterium]|jgi:hypothetical protein
MVRILRTAPWLLLLALLSFGVRSTNNLRNEPLAEDGDRAHWFSSDPDGLYHMRRVERSLREGLPVAIRDPYLAFSAENDPAAAIPWPPYYTLVLHALVRPFAPHDELARKRFVERAVATWPALFSALGSVLVALAAAALSRGRGARVLAGAVAGLSHALAFGSIRYAFVGNGDHHAWVSMLYTLALVWGSFSLRRAALEDVPRSTLSGTFCGVLFGLSIGSWVAALELLALFDLALIGLCLFGAPALQRGLAAFGATLHGAAFIILLPAAVGSPWALQTPTAIINLTTVHLLLLALGFLFFACMPLTRGLRGVVRRAPWMALLLPVGLVVIVLRSPMAQPLEEALVWARGGGPFMSFTNESRPLANSTEGALPLFKYLGYTLPLALAAWVLALRASMRGATEWAPWIVAFPVLLLQACLHRRFADLVLPSQVVLLGWGAGRLYLSVGTRIRFQRSAFLLICLAAVAAHPATLAMTRAREIGAARPAGPELTRARGQRELLRWLSKATPEPGAAPDYSVLAQWDLGHDIVWAGERPVVATNFGSYLGLDSYLDPWRFFLARSEIAAARIMDSHRSRYVVITSRFRRNLDSMLRVLHGQEFDAWAVGTAGRGPLWLEGMGARMSAQMGGPLPAGQGAGDASELGGLGTLRMVYLSPDRYRDHERIGSLGPAPVGAVFERVPGARVRAQGNPGEVLRGAMRLGYPGVARERVWRSSALVGPDGLAQLLVPYATASDAGVPSIGPLRWSLGARRGELRVPEQAVGAGGAVEVPGP